MLMVMVVMDDDGQMDVENETKSKMKWRRRWRHHFTTKDKAALLMRALIAMLLSSRWKVHHRNRSPTELFSTMIVVLGPLSSSSVAPTLKEERWKMQTDAHILWNKEKICAVKLDLHLTCKVAQKLLNSEHEQARITHKLRDLEHDCILLFVALVDDNCDGDGGGAIWECACFLRRIFCTVLTFTCNLVMNKKIQETVEFKLKTVNKK